MVTKARPETQEDLAEVLMDPKRREALFADPKQFRAAMEDYAKDFYRRDPETKKEFKALLGEGMKEFWAANGVEKEQIHKRLPLDPHVARGNKLIEQALGIDRQTARQIAAYGEGLGQSLDGQWPSLGKYLQQIDFHAIQRQGVPEILKVFSEGVGAEGGFLVPEEFRAELLMMALETAVVRPRARVIPMGSLTLRMPAIRDTSHATSVFGGVQASWLGEAASVSTVREPTFQQITLTARKLTGYTRASNEIAQDSAISIEAIIGTLFPAAIAYFEDEAFINGTGAGQPLGIINADALISVAKETGQSATTLVYENLVKMFSRMMPQSMNRAVWVMHPDTFPQLAVLSLSVGTGGSAVWLANAANGAPATILGRPIVFSEKCQTLGTAGDIYFVDFGYYLIGDRMALQMASSPHVQFNTDETVWRFTQRVDGRPWITSALTPRYGTNTMSPFVALAARS